MSALQEGEVSVRSLKPAFNLAPVELLERDPVCGILLGHGGLADNGSRFCSQDCRRRFRTMRDG